MFRCLVFATFLVIAGVSLAVDSVRPHTGSISGSVSDAINAQPLSNASLTLAPVRRYAGEELMVSFAATSDQNGQFEFENVPAGEYFLTARKTGFIDRTFGSRLRLSSGTPITVHVGEAVNGVAVTLLRGAVISGNVVNEDGEAFANVMVRALQYKFSPHGKRLVVISSTLTNDHGEYRLHGLLPGSYYVSCSTARERSIKEDGVTVSGRYPVTFYPSVTMLDKAVRTMVQAGNEEVVNFAMAATRAYTIRGKIAVVDPGHKPALAFAPVVGSGEQPTNVILDDNNTFQIKGVVPGDYRIVALGWSLGSPATGKRQVTIQDGDLNDVLITLENRRPPMGGTVRSDGRLGRLMIRLVPGTSENDSEESTMAATPKRADGSPYTDLAGFFTAAALDRDATRVFATVEPQGPGMQDFYVASVQRDGDDVTNVGFNPANGGRLKIDYISGGATVGGSALTNDGHPIAGATVILLPDESRRERRDLYRFLRADQRGEFHLRGIAPGDYQLLALDGEIEAEAIYDADFMKPFLALSKTLSIKVNSRGKYQLSLIGISDEVELRAQ